MHSPDYVPIPEYYGIAPGHASVVGSLQEMPKRIWEIFEGYLDDRIYQEWWDTFEGEIHPDWGNKPKIPETILLIADDLHWGIGLNYIRCGRQGEPSVVHVEMECPETGEEVMEELAPDFMSFLRLCYSDNDST